MSVSSSSDSRSSERSQSSHGSQKGKSSEGGHPRKSKKAEAASDAHDVKISNEARAAASKDAES